MARFDVRKSLALWTRRERFRKAKHAHYERTGNKPMLKKWGASLRHARAMVALRAVQAAPVGVSARGLLLIGRFEGFRAYPYFDSVHVRTIGYGETHNIDTPRPPWPEPYARRRLRARVNRDYLRPVLDVARSVGLRLKPHEKDALASLVYNLGPGILAADRTMGMALRSKDRNRIANAILVYDKAGGRTLQGLTNRRNIERRVFLTGRYPS